MLMNEGNKSDGERSDHVIRVSFFLVDKQTILFLVVVVVVVVAQVIPGHILGAGSFK